MNYTKAINHYLAIFLPIVTISFLIFVFLGICLPNGWSFFYSYLLAITFCLGIFCLRSFVITKMFNSKTQKALKQEKPNTKKIKIANIAIFGTIQVLFNFIVILPIIVGELSNHLSKTIVFEPITLYTYTAILTLLQIGVQIHLGVISTKNNWTYGGEKKNAKL